MAVSGQTLGKNAFVTIEDGGGTVRAVRTDLSDSTINLSADTPENTNYGDPAHTFQTGGLLVEGLNLTGWFNDEEATGVETVLASIGPGGSTGYVVGPAGSTSNFRKFSACAILQSWEIGTPVADMINITAAFVIRTGSTTFGAFA